MMRIEKEIAFPSPIGDVWAAVTDLGAWFGARVESELAPGAPARFLWPDGTETGAIIEEVSAPRRLRFRWLPFERYPDGSVSSREATTVTITLEETADGSRLRVVEERSPAMMRA